MLVYHTMDRLYPLGAGPSMHIPLSGDHDHIYVISFSGTSRDFHYMYIVYGGTLSTRASPRSVFGHPKRDPDAASERACVPHANTD